MSARRFFHSIIKKTSRTNKSSSSPPMKNASRSKTEEESDDDKEVLDQRGSPALVASSSKGKRGVSTIALDLELKSDSHASGRRVRSMPRSKERRSANSSAEKQIGFTAGAKDDSSPETAPKHKLKSRRTLPPSAAQARVPHRQTSPDDYTDPEDAASDREVLDEREAGMGDGECEYSEPWQNERQGKKMIINTVKSSITDLAAQRLNGTYDEPSDLKRKFGSANGVKTEGHPTSGVSTASIEASCASDYADPWDRLPKSKFPQRVKSNKSPSGRKNAQRAVDADDYDEPSNQKRLNEQGVVVGDQRSQSKSTDDYEDPWDSNAAKPLVSSSKPPKPKPRLKPCSVGSDDYDDPWDNKAKSRLPLTDGYDEPQANKAKSRSTLTDDYEDPWDKKGKPRLPLTDGYDEPRANKGKPRSTLTDDYEEPWDNKGATNKPVQGARPPPPTSSVPARPVERLSSPAEMEKPKLNERMRPFRLDRKHSNLDEPPQPVAAIIDARLPLAKQT